MSTSRWIQVDMPKKAKDLDLKLNEGARARAELVAREGPQGVGEEMSRQKRDVAQYRAGLALLWDDGRILAETGWSAQKLSAIRELVSQLDEQVAKGTDTARVWAEYREQQFQCARELEDLAAIFRGSSQFNALVAAVKARSDILTGLLKAGQDLGVINRASKKIEIRGKVDVNRLSVEELRVHLRLELQELESMLKLPDERKPHKLLSRSPADAVLNRILSGAGKSRVIEAEAEAVGEVDSEPDRDSEPAPREPRVRRLAEDEDES